MHLRVRLLLHPRAVHMSGWELALEYVRALAGPVGTVLTAYVVARFAMTGFRKQKLTERRIDWYEKLHRLLGSTGRAYFLAANMVDPSQRTEHQMAAYEMEKELSSLADQGWLYATQSGLDALQIMGENLARAHVSSRNDAISPALAEEVTRACYEAANALAFEFRRELGTPIVHPKSGVTRTISISPPAAKRSVAADGGSAERRVTRSLTLPRSRRPLRAAAAERWRYTYNWIIVPEDQVEQVLGALEATEANLQKLEAVWGRIKTYIPSGPYFGNNPEHENLRREYAEIVAVMPSLGRPDTPQWMPIVSRQ